MGAAMWHCMFSSMHHPHHRSFRPSTRRWCFKLGNIHGSGGPGNCSDSCCVACTTAVNPSAKVATSGIHSTCCGMEVMCCGLTATEFGNLPNLYLNRGAGGSGCKTCEVESAVVSMWFLTRCKVVH